MPLEHAKYNDQWVKVLLLFASLGCIALLVRAALVENVYPEWRRYREGYVQVLRAKATDERGREILDGYEIRMVQNHIPRYGVTDRCITCHAGIDDPRMADERQPYASHPGRFLDIHPPEQFGCVVCHQGQGRATETEAAHGFAEFWDYPMLDTPYLMSGCAQCHEEEDLFGPKGLIADASGGEPSEAARLLERGRELTEKRGCLGCHARDGTGGSIGPDLTFVGEKTRHDLDFSQLGPEVERKTALWLKKHFLEPDAVSPGTLMPSSASSEEDATALTAYMLSLRRPIERVGGRARPSEPQDLASRGAELYARYCAACHGEDGTFGGVEQVFTPTLNNQDALSTASDDFYRLLIAKGRSGSRMAAWGEGGGNLSPEDIDALVAHLRNWQRDEVDLARVRSTSGDPRAGAAYYRGLCANCHGKAGEGGVGVSLNSPTFLALASDDFLRRTIVEGRSGTAMPAWRDLSTQAVSDLLAHLRSFQPANADPREVRRLLAEGGPELAADGRHIYRGLCASCHGPDGEGGIGPSLRSPDFLGLVSDDFLYTSIVEGRPSTAMPAWRHLSSENVAGLIAHVRLWREEAVIASEAPPRGGDSLVGEIHYGMQCAGCHGERGEGGVGPQIANPAFLSAVSDTVLYAWIARGRRGSAMRGFLAEEQGPGTLSREKIGDVIAFLRYEASREERPPRQTGVGDPRLGAEIFSGSCAACHGPNGEGASGPQLNNHDFLRAAPDGFLLGTLALGRHGTAMQPMVHGSEGLGQIPRDDLEDVVAFLRLWEEKATWRKPREVAELSPRAVESGRALFAENCASCHGPNGKGEAEGAFAPSLNQPEFLAAASDGLLLATIARGRRGTAMRAFGEGAGGIGSLSSQEIEDIVSFIRSWGKPSPKGDLTSSGQ